MRQSRLPQEWQRSLMELTLALYRVTDFFPKEEALRRQLREKANEILGGMIEYGFISEPEREAASLFAKSQVLLGYLHIAQSLKLVNPINISILEREYGKLSLFLDKELESYRTRREWKETELVSDKIIKDISQQKVQERKMQGPGFKPKKSLQSWNEFAHNRSGIPLHEESSQPRIEPVSTKGNLNDRQKTILEQLRETKSAKISDFFSSFHNVSSKTIQRDMQDLVERDILRKQGDRRWTVYSLKDSL